MLGFPATSKSVWDLVFTIIGVFTLGIGLGIIDFLLNLRSNFSTSMLVFSFRWPVGNKLGHQSGWVSLLLGFPEIKCKLQIRVCLFGVHGVPSGFTLWIAAIQAFVCSTSFRTTRKSPTLSRPLRDEQPTTQQLFPDFVLLLDSSAILWDQREIHLITSHRGILSITEKNQHKLENASLTEFCINSVHSGSSEPAKKIDAWKSGFMSFWGLWGHWKRRQSHFLSFYYNFLNFSVLIQMIAKEFS